MQQRQTRDRIRFEDIKNLYDTFREESDRGAAIVGAAYLEQCLDQLVVSFLIDDSKDVHDLLQGPLAPLGTFASKTGAAYCMGLISKSEYDDLNTIRRIRNRFAHEGHHLSFSDAEIEGKCHELLLWRPFKDSLGLDSARSQFSYNTSILLMQLGIRILHAKRERRMTPTEFELKEIVR